MMASRIHILLMLHLWLAGHKHGCLTKERGYSKPLLIQRQYIYTDSIEFSTVTCYAKQWMLSTPDSRLFKQLGTHAGQEKILSTQVGFLLRTCPLHSPILEVYRLNNTL